MTSFQKKLTYEKFYKKMPNGDLDDLIKLMDTKGFDVNYINQEKLGNTPLMLAVLYDRADVAEELVKRGATLKNPNPLVESYINVAARKGSVNMINFLLSEGVNFNNHTINIARKDGHDDVVHILETWEAEQVIPAFNEAGPHMGVGRIHNEDLIDISEYMGKKGRDYGEGIKRKNKKSKNRKTYKRKSMKKKSMKKKINNNNY
jgi:ankyrin repeat protein